MRDYKFFSLIGLIIGSLAFIGFFWGENRVQLDTIIMTILFARLYTLKQPGTDKSLFKRRH